MRKYARHMETQFRLTSSRQSDIAPLPRNDITTDIATFVLAF